MYPHCNGINVEQNGGWTKEKVTTFLVETEKHTQICTFCPHHIGSTSAELKKGGMVLISWKSGTVFSGLLVGHYAIKLKMVVVLYQECRHATVR